MNACRARRVGRARVARWELERENGLSPKCECTSRSMRSRGVPANAKQLLPLMHESSLGVTAPAEFDTERVKSVEIADIEVMSSICRSRAGAVVVA